MIRYFFGSNDNTSLVNEPTIDYDNTIHSGESVGSFKKAARNLKYGTIIDDESDDEVNDDFRALQNRLERANETAMNTHSNSLRSVDRITEKNFNHGIHGELNGTKKSAQYASTDSPDNHITLRPNKYLPDYLTKDHLAKKYLTKDHLTKDHRTRNHEEKGSGKYNTAIPRKVDTHIHMTAPLKEVRSENFLDQVGRSANQKSRTQNPLQGGRIQNTVPQGNVSSKIDKVVPHESYHPNSLVAKNNLDPVPLDTSPEPLKGSHPISRLDSSPSKAGIALRKLKIQNDFLSHLNELVDITPENDDYAKLRKQYIAELTSSQELYKGYHKLILKYRELKDENLRLTRQADGQLRGQSSKRTSLLSFKIKEKLNFVKSSGDEEVKAACEDIKVYLEEIVGAAGVKGVGESASNGALSNR